MVLVSAVAAVALTGCGGAQERKARYVEKGESFFTEQNYEKAGVEFRNALQIDPKDADVRYHVGRVAEKLNNPRDAVGQYQAAIELDPKHMRARAALGRLFLMGGLADKALEIAEPGLVDDPQNAALLTVRGAARSQMGNTEAAFEDAELAVQRAPDDEYAVALLASLYRQSARSDRAIEVVRAGIERAPESVDLRVVLAELELNQDHPAKAETELREVIRLQPKELNHRYRLGRFYLLTKNPAGAEETLREAIKVVPENIDAKVALADLIVGQRGLDAGIAELAAIAKAEPDNAKLQMALGMFLESRGRADESAAVYQAIIKTEKTQPEGLVARTRLAGLLLKKNDVAGANKLVDEVLKENARDNDALVLRGNMALTRGDAAAAITDLRAVLRDQPNSVSVARALARAHLQNDEIALAEETLRSAAQANPTDRQVRLELAQLLAQTGKAEQARPILEQLSTEGAGEVGVLEALFRVQASMKDISAARTTAQSIQRLRPELPLGAYLEGAVNESEKKFDAAIALYEAALKVQPDAGEPLAGIVRIEVQRKRLPQALARLDQAIAANPDNVVARNLKGEVLTAQGQIAAATATFQAAIDRAPQWWMLYRGLALAHLAGKNTDAAISALELGMQKTNGAASLGTELAALYERLGRPDDAIRTYDKMLAQDPASVAVANNLAMLLVSYRSDQPSLDRAQQLTGKLSHVTAPAVLNTRGWVKFKRGEYQESLNLLQQAVAQSPESPVMRYHLGMAQLRTGNRDAARENLEVALNSGGKFVGSEEARLALEELKRAG